MVTHEIFAFLAFFASFAFKLRYHTERLIKPVDDPADRKLRRPEMAECSVGNSDLPIVNAIRASPL